VTEGGKDEEGRFHHVPAFSDSLIAFITDYPVVDRIINHLKLTFVADKPPPPRIAYQELLMAAEVSGEYFS